MQKTSPIPQQEAVDDGPQEVQGDAGDQGEDDGHDGHEAATREEAQKVRHVGLVEPVVAAGGDQAAQDADELGVDLAERGGHRGSVNAHDGGHHSGAEHGLHGQPGDDGGQGGGALLVLGHADGHAQGEQDRHVVDQDTAGLDKQHGDHAVGAPSGGVDPVTDAHQHAADRQAGHRQHQGFAQTLQKTHHK